MEYLARLGQINKEVSDELGCKHFFFISTVNEKWIDFGWMQGTIITGEDKKELKKLKKGGNDVVWVCLEEFMVVPSTPSQAYMEKYLPGSFVHGCDLIEIKRQMEMMKRL